jgi:hypothetical protein
MFPGYTEWNYEIDLGQSVVHLVTPSGARGPSRSFNDLAAKRESECVMEVWQVWRSSCRRQMVAFRIATDELLEEGLICVREMTKSKGEK